MLRGTFDEADLQPNGEVLYAELRAHKKRQEPLSNR